MTPLTIPELLAARAADQPGHVALLAADGTGTGGGEGLTAAQWQSRSIEIGHGLLRHGIQPGDRVGLVFGGSGWLDYAIAFTAVTAVGAVAVPLSERLPPTRIREALDHCGATATIGAGGLDLAQLAGGPTTDLGVRPAPDSLAQIIYTSGTTGTPKGVGATHANLTFGLDPVRRPLGHSRHLLHAFPIGTNAAQSMLCTSLVARPTTVVASRFDPDEFAKLAEAHAVGTLCVVPAMAIALLEAAVFDRHDLGSVVLVASSAAPLPPAIARDLAAALPEATIVNNYTSTESAPAFTSMVFDPQRPASVGRPAGGARLRIGPPESPVAAADEVGEVWLRSETATRSYYADANATAATFRQGWVRMGDLGYVDADGYLYLVDRAADIITTGAHKVSTLRVEAALHEHPAVVEAAVLGLPHRVMGSTVAGAVVLREGGSLDDVRAFLGARLAPHELPTRLIALDVLPRNDGGKVRKADLRELFTLAAAPTRSGPPTTPTEVALAGLWRELLRGPAPSLDDDFFALGGDSLGATRLASAAAERFEVEVPVSLIFETPSLAGQAARLADQIAAAQAAAALQDRRNSSRVGPEADSGADADGTGSSADDTNSSRVAAILGDGAFAGGGIALTSTQESMLAWMWATGEPRDVGPISVGIRVRDQLDPALLERALSLVIARHDALRTVFTRVDGVTTARVLDECPPIVTVVDADTDERAAELVRADREGLFDLASGPLVRAVVVRIADDDHVLGLAVHHLVFDGASMGVLLGEVGIAYSALRTGTRPRERAVRLAYREFVAWTRESWARTLPHWRTTLAGAPAYLEPFRGRAEVGRIRSASLEFTVAPETTEALRRVATEHAATPFMVIAACWSAVLSHWTGTHDIMIMSPVPGRTRPGTESLIGCLVQSLLLRVDTSGDPTFAELLARTRSAALAALDNQHYPFAEFYDKHQGASWLRVESWAGPAHFPGLVSESFELPRALDADWPTPGGEPDRQAPEFAVVEQPDGSLSAWLLWNHHAFARSTMDEMAADLSRCLATAGADPHIRTAQLLNLE
ncbi:acyl-CoA synthetase (AMP-forming)/AMP-acid ligase II/acyl carrier protein [Allocatelliglobosispora scoriae]|uniref:Acyl-CoA synthetase (AMP-forming)/AMP-acid ligase II/acyl carrier protein n=1 Tax=Allocatelliglobosispora scoriae TaxID=643052 RepID=A0A841BY34_9ACTN|nr:condensation domain-containing protein [Allocatelliglobosispora scoriae]MBB5872575.1 acyl-CoA synthetase (AMP-forming)/AMP-acid ligase II/acyl carrier protein [Allocatelliglobosispora scoriae]